MLVDCNSSRHSLFSHWCVRLRAAPAWWKLAVVMACLFLPGRAAAQTGAGATRLDPTEVPLETLLQIPVETASKFLQDISRAPASVSVVTTNEIRKFGFRTLADLLSSVRGFYTSYNRQNSYLGIRGFNQRDFNSRVLVLVDGHRINNNITDGALIGTDFVLDVDMIDRVEIVRGAGSVLYGNNAFFGVVNVITRKGRDMPGLGAEASGEYGSYNSSLGRFAYGGRLTNSLEWMISGSYAQSDGVGEFYAPHFDTPSQNNGIAQNLDSEKRGNFFGSLAFLDFTLQGAYHERNKYIPTAPFGVPFNDARTQVIDGRQYATLKFEHDFESVAQVMAQVYYDSTFFDYQLPLPRNYNSQLFRTQYSGEWWGAEVQVTRHFFDLHTVTVGAEYRDDFRQQQFSFYEGPPLPISSLDPARTQRSHGVYLEGDFALLTNRQSLHLNAGVRYDQYEKFDAVFNPRVALIYNPVGQSVFKAIYGTAFRAPNFLELSDPFLQDVRPETITSYELIYEQRYGQHFRSTVSGFHSQVDDLITYGQGYFQNLNADAHGVGAGLDWQWGGWQGGVSYNWQETRDQSTSEVLTDSPRHVAKANLSVPLWEDKVFASLEFQYLSRRTTAFNNLNGGMLERGVDTAGYGLLHFTLFSRELVKGLEFSASVYNLLDNKYADPSKLQDQGGTVAQNGRTFRVKLTYRF